MKRRFIWSNSTSDYENLESFEAMFLEDNEEALANPDRDWSEARLRFAEELLDIEFMDLCENLDIEVGKIVCIATIQRWDGPVSAYRELKGTTIADCFREVLDESIKFYQEGQNLVAYGYGHDNPVNPSVYAFYAINDGVDEYEVEELLNNVYEGIHNISDIVNAVNVLASLGPEIDKVFGPIKRTA